MKLEGIAAIVTGAASGLGEATARALAAGGAKVAIFDLNETRGSEIAGEIGGTFCRADVADETTLDAAFASARQAHGQEWVLVNCAGIAPGEKTASRDKQSGAIVAHRLASFEKAIRVNLRSRRNMLISRYS